MKYNVGSIRAFIGAKNFETSRQFYSDLGFEEIRTSNKMSYFKLDNFGFYLQDYYVKDWIDNSMLFIEVVQLKSHLEYIKSLELGKKFENFRITEISFNEWGDEFFLYDPSGILWHIGEFKKK